MRLIDADALMSKLTYSPNGVRYREFDCDNFPSTLTLGDAKKLVREEPTVSPWVKTTDRLPTKEDADNRLEVLAWDYCAGVVVKYGDVKDNSQFYPYWMPIPPLPEVEE